MWRHCATLLKGWRENGQRRRCRWTDRRMPWLRKSPSSNRAKRLRMTVWASVPQKQLFARRRGTISHPASSYWNSEKEQTEKEGWREGGREGGMAWRETEAQRDQVKREWVQRDSAFWVKVRKTVGSPLTDVFFSFLMNDSWADREEIFRRLWAV